MIFEIRSRSFLLLAIFFFILASMAVAKVTVHQDTSFEDYVQGLAGNKALDLTMQLFSELGWVLYPIIIAIILFVKKSTRRLGLILLLSLLVGTIATAYLRCYTGYEKPTVQFLGMPLPIKSGADVGVPCKVSGTFPAGHTVRTTIFAFIIGYALSRRFPRGCYLVWLYPVLVSISRLYLLQEYPTTIVAGAVFGILVADIVAKKLRIELSIERSKT